MRKDFIPYATQWIDDDDIKAVIAALRSDYLTQGPRVKQFEEKVARYCNAKYAVAVNSGTSALHAACFAAGICPGDEVITSPITFVASANCVLYCGGTPVFVDIEKDTANIDAEKIEEKLTGRTRAIIPVHYAGHPCDMDKIHKIAKKHHLTVIEDACHALGSKYKGKKIGGLSDMTVLSFHAVKHIATGEGGMILTNNKEYYEKLIKFRTHGITRDVAGDGPWYYEMQDLGYNYRITDFQCALGTSQMSKLDKFIRIRRSIADRYDKAFSNYEMLFTPIEKDYARSAYHIYPVRLDLNKLKLSKKEIFNRLKNKGIGVNVHYIPVPLQPYYREFFGYKNGAFPVAESFYKSELTLPLHPKMTNEDIAHVINNVKGIIGGL